MNNREEVKRELAEYFEDSVYWCTRVPEAWSYGTMTLEDFEPAWGDSEIIESVLEICQVPHTSPTLADHVEAIRTYLGDNLLPEGTKRAFLSDLREITQEER